MSTLGSRLRSAREKKGWSQTDICKKLKISNSTLSGYERDYRKPHPDMIKTFADLYEVTTDYLIGKVSNSKIFISHNYDDTYDSLAEINKIVKELGIEQMGFFDIDKWRNLSPEDVDDIRKHFEWVAQKAKERNEEKK